MSYALRPPPENENIHTFQLIDVKILERNPPCFTYSKPPPGQVATEINGSDFMEAICDMEHTYIHNCKVALIGTTELGNSVFVTVNDFKPYLYYNKTCSVDQLLYKIANLCDIKNENSLSGKIIKAKNVYGWEPDKMDHPGGRKEHEFIQVFFPNVFLMKRAIYKTKCHETQITGETKFMDHLNIVPSSWVKVRGENTEDEYRVSHCNIEMTCDMADIIPVEQDSIAPLMIAAVDIECVSSTGAFPDADLPNDIITHIGAVIWRVGMGKDESIKCIFTVGECDDIPNVEVHKYNTEREMLSGFRTWMVSEVDPDIIATYNGFGFDYEYMWKRAVLLGCEDFCFLDRIVTTKTRGEKKELSSSALGSNDLFIMSMIGRCNLDIFHWIKAREKLESYKLDSVCEHFLGEHKVDMDYKELFKLAQGSSADVAKVAVYCVQDCALLISLILRLQILTANVEMSRVCFTPMEALVTRGQQFKVMNQLVHYGHREGYILNTPEKYSGGANDSYEGATVIDAKASYYTKPIAVLDFMSLYPSIMLANNFCFSTLVLDPKYMNIPGVQYETITVTESKVYTWAKGTVQPDGSIQEMTGLLPIMLDKLLGARKVAKKAKANAKNDIEKAVYDGRQLALKISANSIYGFTGAVKMGKYHCLAVADSTTYKAREMLNQTVDWVKELYKCDVVYGDTDSVMVLFEEASTIEESFKLGDEASEIITGKFSEKYNTKRIVLEMEKVYYPWLLMRKKRYAGLMYEKNKEGKVAFSYLDAKGIELVRRDNCALAKKVQQDVLDALMYKLDKNLACDKVHEHMQMIVNNQYPLMEYKMSKSLRKNYVNEELPHLKVVRKMQQRNPGSEPQVGDRVPFILVETADMKAKACDKAEDPKYIEENKLKVDRLYYVEHQIIKPICGLLDFVVDDAAKLFDSHLRTLKLQRNKQNTIFSFLKRKPEDASTTLQANAEKNAEAHPNQDNLIETTSDFRTSNDTAIDAHTEIEKLPDTRNNAVYFEDAMMSLAHNTFVPMNKAVKKRKK